MLDSWRDIPGYDGKYQADREGNIQRVYRSGKTRLLNPYHRKMHGSQRLIVKLTKDGKSKEEVVAQLVAKTFIGPCPSNHVVYHKNSCQSDNYVNNLEYINRRQLGKLTGAWSRQKAVAKIDSTGEIVDIYASARSAARLNHMSYQTVIDRCNGRCKSAFAPDGYAYAWEDSEISMRQAIRKIELEAGYMPKARAVNFDW